MRCFICREIVQIDLLKKSSGDGQETPHGAAHSECYAAFKELGRGLKTLRNEALSTKKENLTS